MVVVASTVQQPGIPAEQTTSLTLTPRKYAVVASIAQDLKCGRAEIRKMLEWLQRLFTRQGRKDAIIELTPDQMRMREFKLLRAFWAKAEQDRPNGPFDLMQRWLLDRTGRQGKLQLIETDTPPQKGGNQPQVRLCIVC